MPAVESGLVPFQLFRAISPEPYGEPLPYVAFSPPGLQVSLTPLGIGFAQARLVVDEPQRASRARGPYSTVQMLSHASFQVPRDARIPPAISGALQDVRIIHRRIKLERH